MECILQRMDHLDLNPHVGESSVALETDEVLETVSQPGSDLGESVGIAMTESAQFTNIQVHVAQEVSQLLHSNGTSSTVSLTECKL
jgi:hypothetical protein